jgi:long-subunit acyl-CoA synthetase (AMP-forming)
MDAVIDAVKDCKIRAIVCNKINVGKLMAKIKDMPTLKYIIYTNDMVAPDDKTVVPAGAGGVSVVTFEDFVNGGDVAKYPPTPPKAETCAVIMYTSGSTGKPKGGENTSEPIAKDNKSRFAKDNKQASLRERLKTTNKLPFQNNKPPFAQDNTPPFAQDTTPLVAQEKT